MWPRDLQGTPVMPSMSGAHINYCMIDFHSRLFFHYPCLNKPSGGYDTAHVGRAGPVACEIT